MKMGFKKSSILSGYNRVMLGTIGLYGVSLLILYIAYLNGLVGIEDKVYMVLTGKTFANKLVSPFYFIANILEETMPIVLGIILFINYLKIFSYKAIRINITPITNKKKMSKLFLIYGMYYLIYIIISIIFDTLIGGINGGEIIKMIVHYISRIGVGGVMTLPLIIADVKGKTELLESHVNICWGVMLIISTFIIILIIMCPLYAWGMGQSELDGLLLIISIIESLYIFKKIDEVKIV